MQKWVIIGGTVLGLGSVAYAIQLKRLSNEIIVITSPKIKGGKLIVEITFKNPTGGTIKVKHPFVALYKDEQSRQSKQPLLSSQIINKDYTIISYGEVKLAPVEIPLNLFSLLQSVPALLAKYLRGEKIELFIDTVTTINSRLPYSKVDKLSVGGGSENGSI